MMRMYGIIQFYGDMPSLLICSDAVLAVPFPDRTTCVYLNMDLGRYYLKELPRNELIFAESLDAVS